jgi:predicted phage terminase large subunit-like protein
MLDPTVTVQPTLIGQGFEQGGDNIARSRAEAESALSVDEHASTEELRNLRLPPVSDEERIVLAELQSTFLRIPYCPWQPNDGPQSAFLVDMGREALYGGAAGGGKSIAILMAASQFLEVPGYAALLLRKSYQDLNKPGALMDIAEDWWRGQPGIRFDREQHAYIFDCPGGGTSTIVFGALDNENDRFKYQGGAYQFVGFDELTQQKERDYLYLFSRVRRVKEGMLSHIPIRFRGTANPGGVGHEWVHQRFIVDWEQWRRGNADRPKRNFHPALIDDNPKLDREDYVQSLMELDPVTRAQLLKGDWNIRPDGRMFKRSWFKPIDRRSVPGNCVWVRFWDTAATDPAPGHDPDWTVGCRVGRDPQGNYYIDDMRRWRLGPSQSDKYMREVAIQDTRRVQEAMEQDPGAAGKITIHHYRINAFRESNFRAVLAAGKSRGRTTTLTAGRKTPMPKILAAGPLASHAEAGLVYFVADGSWDHDAFLSELEIFPDGDHDDIVDSLSGAVNLLAKMPMWGLRIGDANAGYSKQNEWRPDAYQQGVDHENGWRGEGVSSPDIGIDDTVDLIRQETTTAIMEAFTV